MHPLGHSRALVGVALVGLSLCSCAFLRYHEQRDPPPHWSRNVIPNPDGSACLTVYLYDPGPAERAALRAALTEICRIRSDPGFQRRISAEANWVAGCTATHERPPRSVPEPVSAREVLDRVVQGAVPEFHVLDYGSFGPRTYAETDPRRRAIAIDPGRIADWESDNPSIRALLVDTLAHELSHLVVASDGSGSAFRDDAACRDVTPAGDLVSYKTGYLTGCWYEQSQQRPGRGFSLDECLTRGRGRSE